MRSWIQSLFANRPVKPIRHNPLSVLPLEDRVVPADFRDVGGLRFFTDGIYTNSVNTSTTNSLVQVGLTPGFGETFTPLLDVPAGVTLGSNPTFARINSTLSAGGLTFTGNNLAFAFDTPNKKFSLTGDSSFSFNGVTIGASFGSPLGTNPGLVIQNGKLASIDVGITSAFTVGQVGFNTQDLRLKFDTAAGNRYAISGKATASIQGTSPISLTTNFGESAEEPGLVIVNGKLSQFAVGVSSTFAVGGLALEAKDLSLAFTPGTSSYKFFGTASAKFGNNAETVGFDLLLGNAAQPGVSITNGKLVSLNAGVTSNFNVAGVSINTKALTVALDVPSNTFTVSGSAGFSFKGVGTTGVNLDVALGQSTKQPGIKIVNGKLTELSARVDSNFKLAGLDVAAKGVTFEYNRAANSYRFAGNVTLSTPAVAGRRVLDNFSVGVGGDGGRGIVIKDGKLHEFDVAINGAVNLGPLSATGKALRVQFSRSDSSLRFTGGVTVTLAQRLTASADLINGGLVINTDTGSVRLNGLDLGLSQTRIGTLVINSANIRFTQDANNVVSVSGGADLELPSGILAAGSFSFVRGKLDSIALSLGKQGGIQIPGTPIFVNSISGSVTNIATPDQLVVSGRLGVSVGPKYRILGRDVSLLQADVGFEINLSGRIAGLPAFFPEEFARPFGQNAGFVQLSGRMTLLGDAIPVSSGLVRFGFNKQTGAFLGVKANVELRLYGGFLVGSVDLDLNVQSGNTTIIGTLKAVIPQEVNFIGLNLGGKEIATASVTIRLNANRPLDSSITLTGSIPSIGASATGTITFRGDLTVSANLFGSRIFGPTTFKLAPLFADNDVPAEAPTLRILGTSRVDTTLLRDGTRRKGLRVDFEATPGTATLDQALVQFNVNGGQGATGDFSLGGLATRNPNSTPAAGYNLATRRGFLTIENPDRGLTPNTPFTLTGTISQNKVGGITTNTPAFGPINGIAPRPTVVIQSVERVPNSPTNDVRVTFQATSGAINTATVGFKIGNSADPDLFSTVQINRLGGNQTFNATTGIGTAIIANPDQSAVPGRPFTITAEITDSFGALVPSAPFGPINPVAGPPTILGATTVRVPTIGQAITVPASTIVLNDPAAVFSPTARVRVSIQTDSSIRLEVPTTGIPAGITIEQNAGRVLTLVGTAGDLNIALDLLRITRLSDNTAHSVTIFVSRPGVTGGTVQRDLTIPANTPAIGLTILPGNRTEVNNVNRAIQPYLESTLALEPGSEFGSVRVKLLPGTGPTGRAVDDFFDGGLSTTIPADVPIFANYNRATRTLVIPGSGLGETLADFERAIQNVRFSPTVRVPGTLTLEISLATFDRNGTLSRHIVMDTRTITITNANPARPSAPQTASGGPTRTATLVEEQLLVDAQIPDGPFTGVGAIPIAPALSLSVTNTTDPVVRATVAFIGLYDATSDILAFTPAGGITGEFDAVNGVLTLTGAAGTTREDFQTVLRSVTYNSTRKNPTAYPRKLQFAVTSAAGRVSESPELGQVLVAIEVPTVPPGITATTTALTFPPNGVPVALFPDVDLVYPDDALPPPSVPLGTFIPGSVITGATVSIGTNYIPGEDFLTFTPVEGITGTFFEATGELQFDGMAILADYERIIQSVKYQNKNTSPSTRDRTVELVLDDGSGSGNPPSIVRVVQPQSDGLDTIRESGNLNRLVIPPTTKEASLGLTDLNYAPRPGETKLIYTILDAPQGTLGTVVLTDGTVAEDGMEVPIEQLRGTRFLPSTSPRSGTVPFTFTIAGINPVTGVPTETPLTATVPIEITNVAPVAVNDAFRTLANAPILIDLTTNDTDINTDLLIVESFTQPANGKLVLDPVDGLLVYVPNTDFAGTDSFSYTITDGAGGRSTANVTMTVQAPVVPPPPSNRAGLVGFPQFAVGSGPGASSAELRNPDRTSRFTATPFPNFTGGVRTATADFNGDGVAELVVGTGPGRSTRVLILDGKTQAELFSVEPFEASFTGGVFVAAGDVTGDGVPDLAISPDEGGGPRVDVFSGVAGFPKVTAFFGIDDPNFRGGARTAISDMTGDGVGDLIVVAGFGGGPRVAGFQGKSLGSTPQKIFDDFFAFEQTLRNGIFVSAGDLNGDGFADLIAGGGPGGGPRVLAFDGKTLLRNEFQPVANFFAGDSSSRTGVRLAVKDFDNDNRADLVVSAGDGSSARVIGYLGKSIPVNGDPPQEFDLPTLAGAFVG